MSFNFSVPDVSGSQDDSRLVFDLLLGIGILVCAIMICIAARGDLWLDEIWSIFFAESAKSPWDIISLYQHDNNHVLNTLYLYVIGKQDHLVLYRLLSVVAGVGSLFLLTRMARKYGYLESLVVLLLAGFSYPLILYFSEARGYALAIFFALLSLFLLDKCLTNYSPIKLSFFWLSACMGILSHLSFVLIFLSLSIFVIHKEVLSRSSLESKLQIVFKYLLIPFFFLIAFYMVHARGMTIGGGDANDPFKEISKGVAYLVGLRDGFFLWRLVASGLFIMITLAGSYLYYRDKNKLWSFVIACLLLPPLIIILIIRPTVYYFRYLVVTYPFFYLLLSYILGKLYRRGHKYSYVALILICLYLMGQMQQLWPLFKYGRGNYQAILTEVSNKSSGNVLRIGSDHDFRNKMLLSFYQRFIPPYQSLHYIDQQSWNIDPPEWIILHKADRSFKLEPFISTSDQQTYKLTKVERSVRESGFSWFLYHTTKPKRSSG